MADEADRRSPELEEVRLLLFPHLTAEEGRRRIDDALAGAADPARAARIERLAQDPVLDEELTRRVEDARRSGET